MKELDPTVLLAVLREMLGPLFWPLSAVLVLGALALAALLLRERRILLRRLGRSHVLGLLRRLGRSHVLGLLGGLGALVLMRVSAAGFVAVGGPVDWLLLGLVFVLGVLGGAAAFYTLGGWWSIVKRRRRPGVR
ncbi:hypothetical protein CSC67_09035 [Pusillimonas caeni]|uniref:DUF5368 family protein n=1 Tax=Pusillimonas caeni TaxID=1348472 RepID=UPI000E59F7C0|nr:DUF5368 family protein [Pusillimonas caeni]TFL14283.1 hypothetical protein CSC67_09035 [Pusillimonas caeni]